MSSVWTKPSPVERAASLLAELPEEDLFWDPGYGQQDPRLALARAHASLGEGTDDAALVERLGGRVVVVPGDLRNRKITHPADLEWARSEVEGHA